MNGIPVSTQEREQILALFAQGLPVYRIARRLLRHRWTITRHLSAAGIRTQPAPLSPEERRDARRAWARDRRQMLRAARLCINGGAHGPATHGVRCFACYQTHRRSA